MISSFNIQQYSKKINTITSTPYFYGEYICCMTSVHSCKLLMSKWIPYNGMLII